MKQEEYANIDDIQKIFGKYALPEYLAVKEGLKPLLRSFTGKDQYNLLKQMCREGLYLKRSHKEIIFKKTGQRPWSWVTQSGSKDARFIVYISKDASLLEKAADLERKGDLKSLHQLGLLLGYPKCCVDFFDHISNDLKKTPTPLDTLKNTKQQLSFYVNNVYLESNFEQRPRLLSHIPCSYNCRYSIDYSRSLLKILYDKYPPYAKEIEEYLKLPLLYFDLNNVFAFNGFIKNDIINYESIRVSCSSERLSYLSSYLKGGNQVSLDKQNLKILKDDKLITTIIFKQDMTPVIFNFD